MDWKTGRVCDSKVVFAGVAVLGVRSDRTCGPTEPVNTCVVAVVIGMATVLAVSVVVVTPGVCVVRSLIVTQ